MLKYKLILISFLFAAVFFFGAAVVFAGNITYTSDSDILLTGPVITVTVLTGSKADTVAVDANTITVTISNPDTFTIRSNNRYALTNNSGIGITCVSDYSELVIPQHSGTRTVTVTPSTDTCSYPSVVIVPVTPVSTPTPTSTSDSTSTSTSVSDSNSPAQTAELIKTAGDNKVYVVKDGKKVWIPNAEAFNKAGYDWGKIKTITSSEAANAAETNLIRAEGDPKIYEIKNGAKNWIKTAGDFISKGYKWSDVAVLSGGEVSAYSDAALSGGYLFVKFLNLGSSGDEIKQLQNKLKNLGFFPSDIDATGYFGKITEDAVKKFQKEKNIDSFGYVGPKTREALNQ